MQDQPITVATFYQFAPFTDCTEAQMPLKTFMEDHDVRGTVILATEGMNGTISGPAVGVEAVCDYIRSLPHFAETVFKYSEAPEQPFDRTKVRLKDELISMGAPAEPLKGCGEYVAPADWNALIDDPEVLVIDCRNDYETHLGSFKGAVDPHTKTFKDLPGYLDKALDPVQHKKVAMFCTGGIRCEKSTAYMLQKGFENVYHLEGGILNYLEVMDPSDSRWEGECFVFDERIAVDHNLTATRSSEFCPACGHKLTTKHRCDPRHIPGVSCVHCDDSPEGSES